MEAGRDHIPDSRDCGNYYNEIIVHFVIRNDVTLKRPYSQFY